MQLGSFFRRGIFVLAAVSALPSMVSAQQAEEKMVGQEALASFARIQTSMGDIVVSLDHEAAPLTTQNFLQYASDGHYDRTLIHRVVAGYVIQGGGYNRYFGERPTRDPIPYEGDNGRKNVAGTIAMARSSSPDSAAAQWYINLKDNEELDHFVNDLGPRFGYAVFGDVVEGMDVVNAIGSVSTGPAGPFESQVPIDEILIERVDPLVDWQPVVAGDAE